MRMAILATFAVAVSTGTANAALLTRTYDIEATDFDIVGAYPTVAGRFSITFDSVVETEFPTTDGLLVSNFTLPYQSAYLRWLDGDSLIFGNTLTPSGGGFRPEDRAYGFRLFGATGTTPTVPFFNYADGENIFRSTTVRVSLASAVPEPSAWIMMIVGFAAVGCSLRKITFGPGRVAGATAHVHV